MPKSRNRDGRKNHAKKSRQRSMVEKNKKIKAQKEFRQMIEDAQKKAYENSLAQKDENVVNADEIGDIGDIGNLDEISEEKATE